MTDIPDHGRLSNLTADTHPQYFLADGSRELGGDIIPDASEAHDVGSTTRRVQAVYASDVVEARNATGGVSCVGDSASPELRLWVGAQPMWGLQRVAGDTSLKLRKYNNATGAVDTDVLDIAEVGLTGIYAGALGVGGADPADYSGSGDDLVVGLKTGSRGMSIGSAVDGVGGVYFADPDSDTAGALRYDHDADGFELWTGGAPRLSLAGFVMRLGDGSSNARLEFSKSAGGATGFDFVSDGFLRWRFQMRSDTTVSLDRHDASGVLVRPLWRSDTGGNTIFEGAVYPGLDNTYQLGTSIRRWSALWAQSANVVNSATAGTNATLAMLSGNAGLCALTVSDTDGLAGECQYDHDDNTWRLQGGGHGSVVAILAASASAVEAGANQRLGGASTAAWSSLVTQDGIALPTALTGGSIWHVTSTDGRARIRHSDGATRRLEAAVSFTSVVGPGEPSEVAVGWHKWAGDTFAASAITGGNPEQVSIVAPFDCRARVTIRPALSTEGTWGDSDVKLKLNRSATTVETASHTFSSDDTSHTFDLTASLIDAGDLIHITWEPTNDDGLAIVTLELEPV